MKSLLSTVKPLLISFRVSPNSLYIYVVIASLERSSEVIKFLIEKRDCEFYEYT